MPTPHGVLPLRRSHDASPDPLPTVRRREDGRLEIEMRASDWHALLIALGTDTKNETTDVGEPSRPLAVLRTLVHALPASHQRLIREAVLLGRRRRRTA